MRIARRQFLKSASVVAGVMRLDADRPRVMSTNQSTASHDVRISSVAYMPSDYKIRAQPYVAVTLTDRFWRPRVATNARVNIDD